MRFFHFLEKEGLVLNYLKNNTLDKAQWYTFGHAQYCAFSNYTSYSPSVLFIDLEYLIISIEVFGAFLNVNFESTFWHSSPKMVDVFYIPARVSYLSSWRWQLLMTVHIVPVEAV